MADKKLKVAQAEAGGLTFTNLYRKEADGTLITADERELGRIFRKPTLVTGEASYTSYGSHSFVVPEGVYDVHVVAIGGGAGGRDSWANPAGAGGGLGYKNNVVVSPGEAITVQVGQGAMSYDESGSAPFGAQSRSQGGTSYFKDVGTVAGYGGVQQDVGGAAGPNSNGNGGGYVGDGGGAGGNATSYQGGGGAGGYGKRGGNQNENNWDGLSDDYGGAGGGGYYSSTYGGGAGGGTGLNGAGPINGSQPFYNPFSGYNSSNGSGSGGSGRAGGTNGMYGENPFSGQGESSNNIQGGYYGGGGGGPGSSWPSAAGRGGKGGVRIIWGPNRSFPDNAS
jgi:hypothetical protein